MSNMENFKNIIAEERKRSGMTQEALATRLGITPQAVSKWENGVGYPDVTLFPLIAEVLNVPIQRLFGEKEKAVEGIIPDSYNGRKLIFSNGKRVCYSNKADPAVDENAEKCVFGDGSEADLGTGTVVNRGKGEVRIYKIEDVAPEIPCSAPPTATVFERAEAHFENLELSLSMSCDARVEYDPALAGSCLVHAEGDPEFIAALRVERRDGGLYVGFRSDKQYGGHGKRNKLVVFTDAKQGEKAKISISGAGDCKLPLRFEELDLSIAGCGDIYATDCGKAGIRIAGSGNVTMKSADRDVKVSIAGSGDVTLDNVGSKLDLSIAGSGCLTAQSVAQAECSISGSGDIILKRLTESLSAKIHGSGDIVCGGRIDKLKLDASGGCSFSGQDLSVENAELSSSGSANITIGAITGVSVERLSKSSKLRVGSRGKA